MPRKGDKPHHLAHIYDTAMAIRVRDFADRGLSSVQIAKLVNLSHATLKKYYDEDIKRGRLHGSKPMRGHGGIVRYEYSETTAQKVQALAQYGTRQKDIASILGMDVDTLTKLYRKEFDTGKSMANAAISESLFKKAQQGDSACMMFWLKCQARWHEKHQIDHTSSDGSMSPPQAVELGQRTLEELMSLAKEYNT